MPKNNQETTPEDEGLKMEDALNSMNESSNSILNGSIKTEDEKIDYEDLQTKSPWKLGEIVWAKIGNFPFWPSIVTMNPDTMTFLSLKG